MLETEFYITQYLEYFIQYLIIVLSLILIPAEIIKERTELLIVLIILPGKQAKITLEQYIF